MEDLTYTPIGSVLHLNKAGELAQKRMNAAKLCDGLYITEPDKTQFVKFIVEYNGVKWVEHQAPAANINPANMAKRMSAILASIEGGRLNELNDYHKELHRRIFNPDTPAIMELKKPERKKSAPLPEGAKKVGVIMFKGCTDEMTDKKVIINEVAPHVYTHTYKLKGYGERVKIIFEIDGVYFQGTDNGAYVMESEDFNEICAKAYERARENVADGAAKGMRYFVEVQKRIDAATPAETPQNSTETAVASNVSAKEENTAETAKYRISRFGGYKIIIGNREQGRVIAILMSVNGHNTIEISDESASIATMGEEPLQIDKPIMQLSDAEVLKLIYGSTEPPQPPEIPQRTECTIIASKPRETARKEPKRTISKKERVYYPAWSDKFARYHFAHVNKMASVPILAPSGYAPPIRGDCKICIPQRAKPPNCASCEKINILQPP